MKPSHFHALVAVSLTASAAAGTFNWTNVSGGSWGTAGNWNSTPTFVTDDILDFSTLNITANRTTTLDGNRTAGKLKFGDFTTVTHSWTVNTGSSGTLTLATTTGSPSIEVVNINDVATINSAIAGTQGFSKLGSGLLVLGGSNNYSGATAVSSGILAFAVPAALSSSSTFTAAAGTTFALRTGSGGFSSANLDSLFAGTFTNVSLNSAARVGIDTTTADFTYSSSVSGTFGLTKIGANKLTISGTNSYTGGTFVPSSSNITNSVVDVSGNQSGATGGWEIGGQGGASISGTAVVNFLSGSTVAVAAGKTVKIGNTGAIGTGNQTLNVAGTVTNNGSLTVGRPGILNLNNGGAWTQSGTMTLTAQGGYNATMNVNSGSSFTYSNAATVKLNAASGSAGQAKLTIDGTGFFTTGAGFQQATASTTGYGRITLSNGGKIKLSASVADLTTETQVVLGTGGGVIDTNGFDAALSGIATIGTASTGISGGGGLTKSGGGKLTLTGANTYTGATLVSAGTLWVSGSLGNTAVTVQNGATLGGSGGTIGSGSATVSVQSGGTLAPGASPGILTVNGGVTIASGGTFAYEFTGGSGGAASDLLDVNGTLDITGATLSLANLGAYQAGDKFTLAAYNTLAGTFSGFVDDTNYTFGGGSWLLNYNDTTAGLNGGSGTSYITITAVPESSAAALGLIGVCTLLIRRRKTIR